MYSPLSRRNSYPPDDKRKTTKFISDNAIVSFLPNIPQQTQQKQPKQRPIKSNSWNSGPTIQKTCNDDDFWIFPKPFTPKGSYSEIYRAINRNNLEKVIIKFIDIENTEDKKVCDLREVKKLEILPLHNNIVKYFGYMSIKKGLVFEYLPDGDLHDYLKNNVIYIYDLIDFMTQITNGIMHLHKNLIIHRDLKTPNVLLNIKNQNYKNINLKICDFGSARSTDEIFKKYDSTYYYSAPEILNDSSVNTPAIDIFALGVIMSEMINKIYSLIYHMPYCYGRKFINPLYKEFAVMNIIRKGELPIVHESCPESIKKIMHKCLVYDYTERISATNLIKELANVELKC